MARFLFFISFLMASVSFSQGDDCANAYDFGALPNPANCGNSPNQDGIGDAVIHSGTTVGSTPGNPYIYLPGCSGGNTDMTVFANDVWYTFVATGTQLEINLTGTLSSPNIGLYAGNCADLAGNDCVIGDNAGNITGYIFEPLTPGETYYLQISGNSTTEVGTFDLSINNNVDCSDCFQGGIFTANPPPVNGTYQAGESVEFCFTVTDYTQVSSNWLHGIQVEWSSAWETNNGNLVYTVPATSCNGSGFWDWYPNGIIDESGEPWPAGFYFDYNSGDGPGNNYGDLNAEDCDPQFCWTLTTVPINLCTSGSPLSVAVNTSGDGESGNWTQLDCAEDPSTTFQAILSCCTSPSMNSTDASCQGSFDGSVSAQAETGANPWDYEWIDEAGNVVSNTNNSNSNTNTVSNLPAGTYTVNITDDTGCLSTNVVVVGEVSPIIPVFNQISDICFGGAFNLPTTSNNGIQGSWSPAIDNSQTTTYTFTPNVGECATVTNMTVTVISEVTSTTAITICDDLLPYSWNGLTFNGAGSQTATLTSAAGCDSLATLNLTVNPEVTSTTAITICDDLLPYLWNGLTFVTAGSQTATLTSAAGCDSLATLNLTVNPEVTSTTDLTICDDLLPYSWNGLTFNGAGSQTATLTSAAGCDSLATLNLTVNPEVTSTTDLTICDDLLPYSWNGLTFNGAGSQTATLSSAAGCDSLATLNLTVNPEVTSTTAVTICDDLLPYLWNGLTFNGAGSQTAALTSAAGCDSLATLNLSVNPEVASTTDLTICDDLLPYSWNGLTFNGAGSQTATLTSAAGCDSLATLNLTVNPEVTSTTAVTICENLLPYSWNGLTFNGAGSQTVTLASSVGCDSLATLNLSVNPEVASTTDLTICDDLLPYSWNGLTFNGAGSQTATLTSAAGCDSLATLNLTVNLSNTGTDVITSCDSYTWIDGTTYTSSNNSATVVLSNTAGCDSTVTLNLTITNSNTGTDVITSCDSYTWIDGNTYTSSNNSATVVLSNAAGCDSTVTLDLTINNTPSFTVLGTDPSVCNANDGSITISGLNASTNYMLGYDSLSIVTQIITITTDASGEYIISGLFAGIYANFNIESNNCQFTLSQTVDLNNPGAPSIDPLSNITECDSYILPVITGINLSGNEGYYTQSNGGGIQLISGEVITTSQSIYLYDILGTCADESNFTVTIDNTPSFINPGPQEVCESYSLPLSISGTNLSGSENYYSDLQGNGGTVITDAITSSQTVYIFDVNGACSNEVSFDVTVNDLPTLLNFTGEGIYCEGDVVNNLFAEVSGTPNFTLDYTLDGISNSLNSSISSIDLGNTSGVYILTALNDNYCSVLLNATQTITINSIPDMPIVSQDTSYCENSQVSDFQAFGSFDSYTWYSDEALSQVIGNSETYTPSNSIGTTTYYVTGTENGCESLPSAVTITFENCDIIIPTAFTPNDDSVNDTWEIGNIDDIYPSNVVSIYNRWGSKVFESTSGTYNDEPWSGNYNEKKLPVGSYYYIIEFNDNYTPNATGIVSIIND